jgi:hypothetical protein
MKKLILVAITVVLAGCGGSSETGVLKESLEKVHQSEVVKEFDKRIERLRRGIGNRLDEPIGQRKAIDDGFGFDVGGLRKSARRSGEYAAAAWLRRGVERDNNKLDWLVERRRELAVALVEAQLSPAQQEDLSREFSDWKQTELEGE